MTEMSRYCKAYEARQLAAYPHWKPKLENLEQPADDDAGERRETLADDDILYLHDSFVVTDGIFPGEHVIFDDVTDEWRRFCREELQPPFEIPDFVHEMARAAEEETRAARAEAEAADAGGEDA